MKRNFFFLILLFNWVGGLANTNFPLEIDSLLNLARLEKSKDHALLASGYYEKARRLLKKMPLETCPLDLKYVFFEEAFFLINQNLPLARTKQERQIYLRTEYPFLEDALEVCQQLYAQTNEIRYFRKTFYIVEKSKSLINYFQNADLKTIFELENVPDSLITKKAEFTAQLLSLQDSLRIEKHTFQQKRLGYLRTELTRINQFIQKEYPKYHEFSELNKINDFEDLADNILPNEAILSYFFGREFVYLLIITSEKNAILKLANTQDSNETLLEFSAGLREPALYKRMVKSGHQVFQIFFEPALIFLDNIQKITLIPDGLLGAIPMEAALKSLPEKLNYDFKKLDYLIYDFQFSYNNSVTQYIHQKEHPISKEHPTIAAFAPIFDSNFHAHFQSSSEYKNDEHYLRETRDSLIYLSKNLDWLKDEFDASIYKNEKATLSNFKQHFEADILHFGTHILFDAKFPMQSKIILAKELNHQNQLSTGFLTLEKLQTFQLHGQLAVLAGCESGRGNFRRATGINSLAYGFHLAGTPATVYSLWKVNEQESAALFPLFYKNLQENLPKDEALHLAKLTYLNKAQDIKAAPAYWAAFLVNGDVSPFKFKQDPLKKGLIILLMIIMTFFTIKIVRIILINQGN